MDSLLWSTLILDANYPNLRNSEQKPSTVAGQMQVKREKRKSKEKEGKEEKKK